MIPHDVSSADLAPMRRLTRSASRPGVPAPAPRILNLRPLGRPTAGISTNRIAFPPGFLPSPPGFPPRTVSLGYSSSSLMDLAPATTTQFRAPILTQAPTLETRHAAAAASTLGPSLLMSPDRQSRRRQAVSRSPVPDFDGSSPDSSPVRPRRPAVAAAALDPSVSPSSVASTELFDDPDYVDRALPRTRTAPRPRGRSVARSTSRPSRSCIPTGSPPPRRAGSVGAVPRPPLPRPAARNGTDVAVSITQQLPPLFRLINRLDKEVVDIFCMRVFQSLIKLNDSAPGSMDALCAAQSLCMVPSETLAVGARRPADPHREARQHHMEAQRVDAVSQHPAASPVLINDRQAAIFQLKMFAGRPGRANLSLKAALLNARSLMWSLIARILKSCSPNGIVWSRCLRPPIGPWSTLKMNKSWRP